MHSSNMSRVTPAKGLASRGQVWWNGMRFLLKMFILGFVGLMLLPAFAPQEYRLAPTDSDMEGTPSAFEMAAMVGQVAADMRDICIRHPDICETGGDFLSYAGSKAREGIVVAYAMFRHGHPSMKPEETSPLPTDATPTK